MLSQCFRFFLTVFSTPKNRWLEAPPDGLGPGAGQILLPSGAAVSLQGRTLLPPGANGEVRICLHA
jgi:hypothetical protein